MQIKGEINNRERAQQQRDYSGLLLGNITPTDIDGIIEYKNKGYIILELKHGDAKLPFGQRLALERLTDDLQRSGKPTICIIASHETNNTNIDIDVANSHMQEVRFKSLWHLDSKGELVVYVVERFVKYLDKGKE